MGFFDDDNFFGGGIEELFNRLSGDGYVEYSALDENGKKRTYKKTGNRNIYSKIFLEKVITSKKIYFIFDLSDKKNVSAKTINSKQENKILEIYENDEHIINFPLEDIRDKNFEYKFNNGILEVSFKK